ncbi:hypothetical protein BBW65_06720 [Helicobacter enhydrae]|uniref:Enoyl reductase (ER) domain-containing protein n=1 Tax=Helicobacter enhydrae TaxID=222136 RepID=A0A1B1U6T1_9HELI|nr:NAD(P)-dependent alcohol dehydrogenase [Helicobacter enhydrae]ANV98503.1 hypothetical protein BBW65_06720 [Helicobacter enhydrae]
MRQTNLTEFKESQPISSKGYAVFSKDGTFQPYEFKRRAVGEYDLLIEILYAGICHSDIHTVRGEWGDKQYPLIPGHEIAGEVIAVGSKVSKFKVGDWVGVGCMVNSCQTCESCQEDEEQYCEKVILTYGFDDVFNDNDYTQGGYSNNIVVNENFAILIPKTADLSKVAPLLCAGITTYSPLRATNVGKGDEVAIVGLGGLGHMAVQYASSFGANVSVFATSENKRELAYKLGAKNFINVKDTQELEKYTKHFRVILSTVAANYEISDYIKMLKPKGEMIIVGLPSFHNPATLDTNVFIWNFRRKLSSSLIGGIKETQEMLDYSVQKGIYPMTENISIQEIDKAYERVLKSDVQFRFVIDMKSLKG